MPWLIALRVVSLPATTRRTKNEPNSCSVRRSPSTSELTSTEVEVVGRVLNAMPAEVLDELCEVGACLQQCRHDVERIGHIIGVARAEDDVRAVEDETILAVRNAHHFADDLQRQGGGDVGDEVALALVDDGVDDLRRGALHVVLEPLDAARREAARHDAPQARVPRVVHVDHRAEELV